MQGLVVNRVRMGRIIFLFEENVGDGGHVR